MDIFDKYKEEYVTEENIYKDNGLNVSIGIFPRDTVLVGFANNPYFKIFNHKNPANATLTCRISLLSPSYQYHDNDDGTSTCFLNNNEKKYLMELLSKERKVTVKEKGPVDYDSIWEALCGYISYVCGINYRGIAMPNYMELEVDKEKAKKHRCIYKTGQFF